MKNLIDSLIHHLESLPDGTQTSTYESLVALLGEDNYATEYLFRIDEQLRKEVPSAGLILDGSAYENVSVGLPFNIPFVVRHNNSF